MKAAVYYANGGPEVLRYEDVPDPVLGDGEILIRVAAIGVQGGDVLNRFGTPVDAPPHIVGYQAAGTVEAVGTDVAGFAVGHLIGVPHTVRDRVDMWLSPWGGMFHLVQSLVLVPHQLRVREDACNLAAACICFW